MSPQEIDALRKEVKKLMIDLDLDVRKQGALALLAADLGLRLGKGICRQTLSMALSGFRTSPAYQTILAELRTMLSERLITPV